MLIAALARPESRALSPPHFSGQGCRARSAWPARRALQGPRRRRLRWLQAIFLVRSLVRGPYDVISDDVTTAPTAIAPLRCQTYYLPNGPPPRAPLLPRSALLLPRASPQIKPSSQAVKYSIITRRNSRPPFASLLPLLRSSSRAVRHAFPTLRAHLKQPPSRRRHTASPELTRRSGWVRPAWPQDRHSEQHIIAPNGSLPKPGFLPTVDTFKSSADPAYRRAR